jgi:hypothetical protein
VSLFHRAAIHLVSVWHERQLRLCLFQLPKHEEVLKRIAEIEHSLDLAKKRKSLFVCLI